MALLILLPLSSLLADPLPQGLPPLHVTSANPEAFPRFYSVAQAPDGLLFVAGEEGVHAFDGRHWSTTELPNKRFVRSLEHDGQSRLYVGGYGQFGYIETNPAGQLHYTDLTPDIDSLIDAENFADVWRILITPEGVFFRALFHLFRYQPESGELQVWHHPDRFGGILWHQNEVLLQFRGRGGGLRRFDGDGFEDLPGGQTLTEHVVAFLPLPDGGLLTMGRDGLWRRFLNGELSPWPAPESLPTPENFDAYLVLSDGSFALGSPDGKLHLVDPHNFSHRSFQIAYGFISELAPAVDGGILVQTDQSTTHLFWPSPWTRLGTESGLVGRVNDLAFWNGEWLAVTSAGAQEIHRARFESTGWSAFETWDWLELSQDRALLADSFNLLEIRPDEAPRLLFEDLYPRTLLVSKYRPDHILIGTELGLAVAVREDEVWRLVYRQEGFTGLISAMIELNATELLLAINGAGLVRARMSADFERVEDWQVYDSSHGIDYGSVVQAGLIRTAEDDILVSTRAGFYRWTETGLSPVELPGIGLTDRDRALVQFARSPDGQLWAYRERQLWQQVEPQRWIEEDLSSLEPGVIASISFADDGQMMVGDQAAILQYDPNIQSAEPEAMQVQLRQVQLIDGQGEVSLLPLDGQPLILPHDITSMRFDYALPNYRQPQLNRYRARMLGYEAAFSSWGQTQRITYSMFTPGVKRFEVEARDHLGRISAISPFEFEVLPPWYATLWARLLWFALVLGLLALLVGFVIRWRLARLEAERQRLAQMVEQRTADLAAANRKLENMANVDGLTGVANRRRLDEYLEEAWHRCADRQCDLAIALIDVDHFKQYNDSKGHQAGDEALRTVADVLTRALRRNEDVVARYGGEEFMVVLPAADLEHGREVAEVLRAAVEASPLGITASLGVAAMRPHGEQQLSALIEAADQALYRAKQHGRNRVETAN